MAPVSVLVAVSTAVHSSLTEDSALVSTRAWWDADQFWVFVRSLQAAPDGSARAAGPGGPFVAGTGLRLGEVCALRWSDVDLDRGVLIVYQPAVQIGKELTYSKPKTRSGEDRAVPLAGWVPKAWTASEGVRSRSASPSALTTSTPRSSSPSPTGPPCDQDSVSRAFTRLVRSSSLPPCRFHDLRHVAATTLLQAGVPMPVVSKILGHSSIQITVDTYRHMTVDPALHDQVHRALSAFVR